MEPIIVSQIVDGENLFHSKGISIIQVSKRDDRTMKVEKKIIALPIRSVGIMEIDDALEKSKPRPPTKVLTIKAGSKEGKIRNLRNDALFQRIRRNG